MHVLFAILRTSCTFVYSSGNVVVKVECKRKWVFSHQKWWKVWQPLKKLRKWVETFWYFSCCHISKVRYRGPNYLRAIPASQVAATFIMKLFNCWSKTKSNCHTTQPCVLYILYGFGEPALIKLSGSSREYYYKANFLQRKKPFLIFLQDNNILPPSCLIFLGGGIAHKQSSSATYLLRREGSAGCHSWPFPRWNFKLRNHDFLSCYHPFFGWVWFIWFRATTMPHFPPNGAAPVNYWEKMGGRSLHDFNFTPISITQIACLPLL